MTTGTRRYALLACFALLACGRDEESMMERGLTVDREVAAPESEREQAMTDKEREQQRIEEQE